MKTFLNKFFQYNFEMNENIIQEYFHFQNIEVGKVKQLFDHILNAHNIWNNRILEKPAFKVWEKHGLDKLKGINENNFHQSLFIIENLDLQEKVEYNNSIGNRYSNTIEDMLMHVVNHSSYHRGQIALLCRQNEIKPLVSDYIFHVRENHL